MLQRAGLAGQLDEESLNNIQLVDASSIRASERINKDPEPLVIERQADEPVQQIQKCTIRYLQPPKLRTPSPNVILERQATPLPSLPPIRVRQQVRANRTPTPLLIRERAPQMPELPPKSETHRVVPARSPLPRQVIIERVYPLAKPREIIYEVSSINI